MHSNHTLGGLSASFAGWGAGGFAVAVAAASGLLFVAVVGDAGSLWVQWAGVVGRAFGAWWAALPRGSQAHQDGSSHTAGRVWGGGHMSLSRTSLRPTCQRRAHDSEAMG